MSTQLSPNSARSMVWNGTIWVLTGNADDRISGTIRKSANQTVTNSTTVQNDNEFSFPVKQGETWIFQINAITSYAANAYGGLKVRMQVPSATNCSNTISTNFNAAYSTNASCNTDLTTLDLSGHGAMSTDAILYLGVFKAGANGTAQFMWAQSSSNAALTSILRDSTMTYTRLSGADVAEVYYTHDQKTSEGDIVSLNGEGISQVSKSTVAYDTRALGVISTKPGLTLGEADGTGRPVIVGLSGRVPVKVSTKNGDIKPGDYITTSDIPGVGMKATEAGRVIGKALTGLSGVDTGVVGVFIQNTYFDGVDEGEYSSFLTSTQSGNILTSLSSPMDRFSFMVNKSLKKIDPSYGSGGMTNFAMSVNSLARGLDSLSGSVSTIFERFTTLSTNVSSIQAQINTMSGVTQIINNTSSSISTEDQSVLDAIMGTIDSLLIQVRTTFSEIVIFIKSVTFQSTVIFQDRVTFQDRDMAGTAILHTGQRSIRVIFAHAYTETPKITLSADTFDSYRVTKKSTTGFTIETKEPVTSETSFDWIAIMVP